jgi:protein gp37
MSTGIEWTDETWNPIIGCSVLSPGCTNCYAMRWAHRIGRNYKGLTELHKGNAVWNGEVKLIADRLLEPATWRKPRHVFVDSMGDLFHENIPAEWIVQVFAVMSQHQQHIFQILTKRPARMLEVLSNIAILPNVWLGVSIEDQLRAEERVPLLLKAPAVMRFVSAEPLLGPIDLTRLTVKGCDHINALTGIEENHPHGTLQTARLDWVIAGGESGTGARVMHPYWPRSLRDQCAAAGVPFFFKQWGDWAPAPDHLNYEEAAEWAGKRFFSHHSSGHTFVRMGKPAAGRSLDGVTHDAMPQRAPVSLLS